MNIRTARVVLGIMLIAAAGVSLLSAQEKQLAIAGTVTDASGKALAGAKVTAKNLSTGESVEAQTDADGHYSVANLAAGDYEVSVAAQGFAAGTAKVTVTGENTPAVDIKLNAVTEAPGGAAPQNLPNAPSSSQTEPSLGDLGFPTAETQANAKEQALLDRRTHMLKIHQRMGLITAVPMFAALITSINAGGRSTGTSSRDLHVALGALTGDLYGITAYYAIRAPRIPGTQTRGPIRFHKAMAWIHGPGMILTPILGAMAFEQKNNGEKVHGLASAHGPVAIVTAGAFAAALLSVSVKF